MPGQRYADPISCAIYYECSEDGSSFVHHQCPKIKNFDYLRGTCRGASKARCLLSCGPPLEGKPRKPADGQKNGRNKKVTDKKVQGSNTSDATGQLETAVHTSSVSLQQYTTSNYAEDVHVVDVDVATVEHKNSGVSSTGSNWNTTLMKDITSENGLTSTTVKETTATTKTRTTPTTNPAIITDSDDSSQSRQPPYDVVTMEPVGMTTANDSTIAGELLYRTLVVSLLLLNTEFNFILNLSFCILSNGVALDKNCDFVSR